MNKEFLKYLSEKPHSYLLVWGYIFANTSDDNVFSENYSFLLSRFKISRSTLQRVIESGVSFLNNNSVSGQKVGRNWAAKELVISIFMSNDGQKVGRKRAGKSSKMKDKTNEIYSQMVAIYDDFCLREMGMGAKIDGLQGKSLKSIIEYLEGQVQKKQGQIERELLNEEILKAWSFILNHWQNLGSFYKSQIKLNQINSNLPNILTHLKNANSTNRAAKFANAANQTANISFE